MLTTSNRELFKNYNEHIECLRKEMIRTASVLGLNHPKVLYYSQEIDRKHNDLLRLKQNV
ncbi:aspartyl-phosphate phosphatase Spo0E family protein [Alkalihalobacillus sp. AL-G]|uniref:aspartyl-phosphate phosphatase Spo0E family protein n=1 Tax=Alkalihalobacillus sp. AL-G TaxID=2926399 RepID=UPI00272A7B73|nr:aspartyl-phosphate phosphatase Spo0E family protein [Alkalihalobacillus sp. AL-G]WLD92681.1 aspartyl-phosphate phosphatase Spo0E family protein [Alkalihalobacillus sp. AL-G]